MRGSRMRKPSGLIDIGALREIASQTFPGCPRRSAEYLETDANALIRHLRPRDDTEIRLLSPGHYCMHVANVSRPGAERSRNKRRTERRLRPREYYCAGEELISVFQTVCSCLLVCIRASSKHKGTSRFVEPLTNSKSMCTRPYGARRCSCLGLSMRSLCNSRASVSSPVENSVIAHLRQFTSRITCQKRKEPGDRCRSKDQFRPLPIKGIRNRPQ